MSDHRISLILPLKREKKESIQTTLDSLERVYNRSRFSRVYVVYPEKDLITKRSLLEILRERRYSFDIEIIESSNSRGLKASDLNHVINEYIGDEDIVGIFDADDHVDPEIINIVTRALERGYAAVSPRVYRYRLSFFGRLVFAETILWYDLWLRILEKLDLHTPLSGEGLFFKADVVKRLGGFPEELAEDAALSILLAMNNHRYGYIDSYVIELAPRSLSALIKQRIRWYKGHLRILVRILRASISKRVLARILSTYSIILIPSITYLAPVGLEVYVYLSRADSSKNQLINLFSIEYLSSVLDIVTHPDKIFRDADPVRSLIAVLLYIYMAQVVFLIYRVLRFHRSIIGLRESIKTLVVSILALPLYWFILAIAFLVSMIPRRVEWYRTDRR